MFHHLSFGRSGAAISYESSVYFCEYQGNLAATAPIPSTRFTFHRRFDGLTPAAKSAGE
jgi:hypothetical protein